jgi:hypothetical protein
MREPNVWTISNELFAHIPEKIQKMKITPDTLGEASADLVKIQIQLFLMDWGGEIPQGARVAFSDVLSHAWHYKPPLQDRGSRKNRGNPRLRPRQQKASGQ